MMTAFAGVCFMMISKASSSNDIEYPNQMLGLMLASVPPFGFALASIGVRKLNEELHWIYSLFYNMLGPPMVIIPILTFYPSLVHIT